MDIKKILNELSLERKIFSSEADFQHALAWHLHLQDPYAKIRLEHRPQSSRMYIDIVIESGNKRRALELKYKTRKLETTVKGESFWLTNHGAADCGRYDVLKDIERLEKVVDGSNFHEGFVIFLTNDPHYFVNQKIEKETIDQQFRLKEGRTLNGVLSWSISAGSGTTKGRTEPIRLDGSYIVNWKPYSSLDAPFGEFQIMIVHITPCAHLPV